MVKIYIDTKKMTFEEDNIEHEIVLKVSNEEFYGYDIKLGLPANDKFIKDTLKIFYKKNNKGKDTKEIDHKEFIIREQQTWNSFPLYEIVNNKILKFNYKNYTYFNNTNRRMALAFKINELYNQPAEAKLVRKTLKKILDHLEIIDEDFEKYNDGVNEIINKNPK